MRLDSVVRFTKPPGVNPVVPALIPNNKLLQPVVTATPVPKPKNKLLHPNVLLKPAYDPMNMLQLPVVFF
jgi:hypothetical protein